MFNEEEEMLLIVKSAHLGLFISVTLASGLLNFRVTLATNLNVLQHKFSTTVNRWKSHVGIHQSI